LDYTKKGMYSNGSHVGIIDKYNIIEITMPSNIIKIEDIHLII